MSDKVLELRQKHPIADFFAGFVPGVGEALDAHDFYHAAKNKDLAGMLLSSAGLVIPGLTGALLKSIKNLLKFGSKESKTALKDVFKAHFNPETTQDLSNVLIKKGVKQDKDGWSRINNKNFRYVVKDGGKRMLVDENTYNTGIERLKNALNLALKKDQTYFNHLAKDFYNRTGLNFSTDNWKSLGGGHDFTKFEDELEDYISTAGPSFMDTYDNLIKSGKLKKTTTKSKISNKDVIKYQGYFDEPLITNSSNNLSNKYGKGMRNLDNDKETMRYVVLHSPQAQGKFIETGMPMITGIPKNKVDNFEKGIGNQRFPKWTHSNLRGASYYSRTDKGKGRIIYTQPVKTDKSTVRIIKLEVPNAHSNNYNGGGTAIGNYAYDSNGVHITDSPIIDDAASTQDELIKGHFGIIGDNIPVKSIFGGSGMFKIDKDNLYKPFKQLAIPIGVTSLMGLNTYNRLNNE